MIRVTVNTVNFGAAAHVAGAISETRTKSFDVFCEELEMYLRQHQESPKEFVQREIVGFELLPNPKGDA